MQLKAAKKGFENLLEIGWPKISLSLWLDGLYVPSPPFSPNEQRTGFAQQHHLAAQPHAAGYIIAGFTPLRVEAGTEALREDLIRHRHKLLRIEG